MGGITNIPGFIDSLAEEIPSAERGRGRGRGGGRENRNIHREGNNEKN